MRHPAAFQEAASLFYEENVFVLSTGTLRCAESYKSRAKLPRLLAVASLKGD